jgi:PAS domain S-box-containing protein
VQLLQLVADRMALAIDRARLYTREQEAREQAEVAKARAEAALAQAQVSEHRYRRLVGANIFGITVTDTERVLEANEVFLHLVGYTEDDVQAGRLRRETLTMPDTHALSERSAQEAVAKGASPPFEREYVRKDGSRVPVLVAPVLLQRDPVRLLNIVLDLSERKQLEQALAERVVELEAVMQAVPEALAVYDPAGRVILANAAFRARVLPGETLAERVQHTSEVLDAQGRPLEKAQWPQTRALQGEVLAGADAVELSLRRPGGEFVCLSVTSAPLRDQAGNIIGTVALNQNITARKRLEQEREAARAEAEQQAAQLAAIFEAMADGVAVFDAEGHLVRENAAQRRIEGRDTLSDTVAPDRSDLSLRERLARFAARDMHGRPLSPDEGPLPRALRGEILSAAETIDLRSRTLDGREVELSVSAAPLRDRDGHLTGAVAVFRDQTEQKQLERERAEQAEQLDRLFEGIADGLLLYNTEGQLVRLNVEARRILGLDAAPTEYARLSLPDRLRLFEAYDDQGHRMEFEELPVARVLRGQVTGAAAREIRLRTLDGHELELYVRAEPLRDAAGRLTGVVTVMHDQTAEKRLTRQEEEAHAQKLAAERVAEQMSAFLATAAHDIRSPLTVAAARVQMAMKLADRLAAALDVPLLTLAVSAEPPKLLAAEVRESLQRAHTGMDQLKRQVKLLFDVTQAQSQQLVLELAAVDLRSLVQEQVAALQVGTFGHRLHVQVPANAVLVEADADRLDEVLSNFVSNALKYSPMNQPVTVELAIEDQEAVVRVVDQGPGIPFEEQGRIWDPFYRSPEIPLQPGNQTEKGSLGLGLAICKQLIELHPGGGVGVESVVGKGATFWFRLPLAS